MKNLARWLKFLLLVGVLFVPFACDRGYWFWDRGYGRDRDGRFERDERRGGDDRGDRDGRTETVVIQHVEAEKAKEHPKEEKAKEHTKDQGHEDEGHH